MSERKIKHLALEFAMNAGVLAVYGIVLVILWSVCFISALYGDSIAGATGAVIGGGVSIAFCGAAVMTALAYFRKSP